tara:strand:+ start:268 stop:1962 length:1695 start_codon:yes stop_codon:yes gene_type:complete
LITAGLLLAFVGGALGGSFWLVTKLLGGEVTFSQSAAQLDRPEEKQDGIKQGAPGDSAARAQTPKTETSETETTQAERTAGTPDPIDPEAAPQEPALRLSQVMVEVKRGDTLIDLLTGAGAPRGDAQAAINALATVFSPRKLRVGQQLELAFAAPAPAFVPVAAEGAPVATDRALMGLTLLPSAEQEVAVFRQASPAARAADDGTIGAVAQDNITQNLAAEDAGGARGDDFLRRAGFGDSFAAKTIDRPLTRVQQAATGAISSSLYNAAVASGVPNATLVETIRLLSFDVDFQRDVQKDDSFELLFEVMTDADGNRVKTGDVLFAEMVLSGKPIRLYRFAVDEDRIDYFNEKGESARKGLLRTPVDGARISSRFGPRKHPVLGYRKQHKGLDFAAPTGTPIYAAGDGTLNYAGRNGSFGVYARIRHNASYQTAYAHMDGLAKGIRKGGRVRQGQVIGYVGTSGRSTGPHLHYEVLRDGVQINPTTVKMPKGEKLIGDNLARFQLYRAELDRQRDTLLAARRDAAATVVATTGEPAGPDPAENQAGDPAGDQLSQADSARGAAAD